MGGKKEMNKPFYWFYFEDGYRNCCMGYSAQEMRVEVRKHGKLLRKELA